MMRRRGKDRHLPPCVYLHHGAYFYVKGGKWTRLGVDLADALAQYARLQEAKSAQRPGGMPWLIDEALAAMEPRLSDNTRKGYRVAAKKLKTILTDFRPEQVLPKHVAAIKLRLADKPNMANRCVSLLRSVFAYALEHQLIDSNPAVGIKRHREAKRGRLLSAEEFDAIYRAAGARLQVIMDLCALTGQRISDVLRISRADLVEDGIRFVQQKTGTRLVVRWTPQLRAVVERGKGLRGNVRSLTLLSNRRGKAPDYKTVQEQWRAACETAGIANAHLHDLRAMAITQTKREGKNPRAVAGHSTEAQTLRYLRDRETPIVDGPEFLPRQR